MKSYIKSKSGKNQVGPGFRTSDFFRGSKFGKSQQTGATNPKNMPKFNPGQFKIQHKG